MVRTKHACGKRVQGDGNGAFGRRQQRVAGLGHGGRIGTGPGGRGHHCRPAFPEWSHGRSLPHHQPPPLGHDCGRDGADGRGLESDLGHHLHGGVWHRGGRHDSLLEQVAASIEPRPILARRSEAQFLGHRQSHRRDEPHSVRRIHDADVLVVPRHLPHRVFDQPHLAVCGGGRPHLLAVDGPALV